MTDNFITSLGENTTFAITADSGELAWQAERLVISLVRNCPESNVVVFIPKSAIDDLSNRVYDLFESHATIVTGEIPLAEYPISAMIQAFVEAEQISETEYLVALDTDTLVLDTPTITGDADVWARPADVGVQYWTTAKAADDWKRLCDAFDLPHPYENKRLVSTVDRTPIPPYYNSGVVVTTDRTLPKHWLDLTTELIRRDDLPVESSEFFTDQISLALALRNRRTETLSSRANYPLGGRLHVPSDVEIIHYGDQRNLSRIISPSVRRKLRSIDALPTPTPSGIFESLLDVASTQSGKILSYKQKQRLRGLLKQFM
jgi:hypothetical protein